jgi:hypothetical protein
VATESGAGCTSGACSSVQNTAFPGRACSRKGGSSGGQGRQPAPGEPQGPRGWNSRAHSGTAGGGVGRNVLIAVLTWLAIWNPRALTPLRGGGRIYNKLPATSNARLNGAGAPCCACCPFTSLPPSALCCPPPSLPPGVHSAGSWAQHPNAHSSCPSKICGRWQGGNQPLFCPWPLATTTWIFQRVQYSMPLKICGRG